MKLRRAYEELAHSIEPNWLITFNFGYAVNQDDGERYVKHYFNRVQRMAIGPRWAKKPAENRISAVGVWEHMEKWSNPHLHVLARVRGSNEEAMTLTRKHLWSEVTSRGQLHISPILSVQDVAHYTGKELTGRDRLDRLFVYGPGAE